MVPERSVLQMIREKELEISVIIEQVKSESDAKVERARREAAEIINTFNTEGKEAAGVYYNTELETIRTEIARLNKLNEDNKALVRKKWENNLLNAISRIVEAVTFG